MTGGMREEAMNGRRSFIPPIPPVPKHFWSQLCHQRIPVSVLGPQDIIIIVCTCSGPTLLYNAISIGCGIRAQNMTGAVLANTMT